MVVAQELRSLQSDILAPDDVLVLLDGTVTNVTDAMRPLDRSKQLNFRLFSIRPSDLDKPEIVKASIKTAQASIENGLFDAMFLDASATMSPKKQPDPEVASKLKTDSQRILRTIEDDPTTLALTIAFGKNAVQKAHALGIRPTDERDFQHYHALLTQHGNLLPTSFDSLFASKRIPFIISQAANTTALRPQLTPGEEKANFVFFERFYDETNSKHGKLDILTTSRMIVGLADSLRLDIVSNKQLASLPGIDFSRVKYYMDRKRPEINRYNNNGHLIHMHAPENDVRAKRSRGGIPDGFDISAAYNELGTLSESHFLLEAFRDEPERSTIRDRFDAVIKFRDEAISDSSQRIDEYLNQCKLPTVSPVQNLDEPLEHPRTPITVEAAISRVDRFARSQLPSHYRLRSLFQATPNHPIVLKLTDDTGHTAESTITTFEPDATRALDIKRRVQAHLLDIPGIAPYRGPLKEASHNIALDELLPSAPGRQRVTPKYGEYRLRIAWDQPKEEISISLGLNYSADNQPEAERRAAFVEQEITRLRDANPNSQCLPITKRDLCDSLRNHVRAHGGAWEELTHGQIDGFPASLRFPFAGRGHEQDSWLQIDALKTDGNPNLTWVLPIHVIVNGQKLANASTHVNLHVRDRQAAEARAIETVNRMMTIVSELPNHAQFAVDPELPRRLHGLSEAARAAAPHLIDTNRLKDIQNELRSPHQQDLTVRVIGEPRLVNGKQEFALGIFRGAENGVMEPVLEQPDLNQPPTAVRRSFAIDADKTDAVPNFEQNVRQTFQSIINEEYDPRSSRNFDREHMRKLKAPRPFHPDYAPLVLDDAIGSNLASSPAVTPVEPASYQARGRTHRAGQGPQAGVAGRH